jgi:hypothetical protein
MREIQQAVSSDGGGDSLRRSADQRLQFDHATEMAHAFL